jgi:SAM-dependent methyltransferase
MDASMHLLNMPSEWVERYSPLIREHGSVLDVACGSGRHMKRLSALGLRCLGIDRNEEALVHARLHGVVICADIEAEPWPIPGRLFDAVVVTNYLWRPLYPHLIQSLKPDGVLLYETFALGHETVGKPSRPEFLLQPGELLALAHEHGLNVVAFEDVWLDHPRRRIQRLAATR